MFKLNLFFILLWIALTSCHSSSETPISGTAASTDLTYDTKSILPASTCVDYRFVFDTVTVASESDVQVDIDPLTVPFFQPYLTNHSKNADNKVYRIEGELLSSASDANAFSTISASYGATLPRLRFDLWTQISNMNFLVATLGSTLNTKFPPENELWTSSYSRMVVNASSEVIAAESGAPIYYYNANGAITMTTGAGMAISDPLQTEKRVPFSVWIDPIGNGRNRSEYNLKRLDATLALTLEQSTSLSFDTANDLVPVRDFSTPQNAQTHSFVAQLSLEEGKLVWNAKGCGEFSRSVVASYLLAQDISAHSADIVLTYR